MKLDIVHLDDARVRDRFAVDGLVNANAAVVLPAQVEVDVLGDDESARGPVAVLVDGVDLVTLLAGFLANQAGRVAAEEGFDGEEAAADDDQVGFNHAVG